MTTSASALPLTTTYEVSLVWDQHREIMRRLACGQRPREIAQALGIGAQTVRNVSKSGITRKRINELHEAMDGNVIDMTRRIKALAPLAVAVEEELLMRQDVSPAVRVVVAKDLLDRGGYVAPREVKVEHKFGLSEESREVVKQRARELGLQRTPPELASASEGVTLPIRAELVLSN